MPAPARSAGTRHPDDAFTQVRSRDATDARSRRPATDGQTIGEFEADLSRNLYRIWNRMSSGTYFPPAVRAVPIPKKSGGQRMLGVPTVSDRIAQTAVALVLEPELEGVFRDDSYGYRPGRSAHDALAVTRKRCWERDWVLEYDIRGLFDNIDHELLLRALRKHCDQRWALLLVERWLTRTAPPRRVDVPPTAGRTGRSRPSSRCVPAPRSWRRPRRPRASRRARSRRRREAGRVARRRSGS